MRLSGKARLADYEVMERRPAAQGVWELCLRTDPAIVAKLAPGMFVNVAVPGDPSHLLRIPLSFYGADPERGDVHLAVAEVGEGTRRLCALPEGTRSTLVGPLGRGWRMPKDQEHPALLVAGGVGAAPIVAAARMLLGRGVDCDVILGAQSEARLWRGAIDLVQDAAGDAHATVRVTTDDGSYGEPGFPTALMERLVAERTYGSVLTCGPTPLMAGVARIARDAGLPCQASLERMMTCGFGACNTCNVAVVGGGYKSCCMEGPVFDAAEVVW